MSSAAKIAANRKNARKSTGPRSARGKTKSRINAVKYGIHATTPVLPGEDEDAYRDIVKLNMNHFAPVGPVESLLVDQIIAEQWRLNRIERAEPALHAQLREGQIVRFLGSLDLRELSYVRSAYADKLRTELEQDWSARQAESALEIEEREEYFQPGDFPLPEVPVQSDDEAKSDVEAKLGRILELDTALLEVLVPSMEGAPQAYLVQERRTAMRAYLSYVGKLQELQEARLTVTVPSRPLIQDTSTAENRKGGRSSNLVSGRTGEPRSFSVHNDTPER